VNISNKEFIELFKRGKKGNWDPFFTIVDIMARGIAKNKFPDLHEHTKDKESAIQEAILEVWRLVLKDKINPKNNIFSYITGRIIFKYRDLSKAYFRRKNIIEEIDLGIDITEEVDNLVCFK
jgi:hypothetical protein